MKFYRKIEYFLFLFFSENFLLKIEPSEITIFLQHFFGFGGGEISPHPPWQRPCPGGSATGTEILAAPLRGIKPYLGRT